MHFIYVCLHVCSLQLEESEFTCAAAVKARKSMEVEIEDLHVQMDDISKSKQAVSLSVFGKRITLTFFYLFFFFLTSFTSE